MKPSQERGAAAVEFALVASLLLLLVFGGVEMSRLWYLQSTLAASARDAAREVAINHVSLSTPELETLAAAAVDAAMGGLLPESATVNVAVPGNCSSGGGDARVEAAIGVGTMTGLLDFVLGEDETVTLRGVGVMRCNG